MCGAAFAAPPRKDRIEEGSALGAPAMESDVYVVCVVIVYAHVVCGMCKVAV